MAEQPTPAMPAKPEEAIRQASTAAATGSTSPRADEASKVPAAIEKDLMRELLDRMQQMRSFVAPQEPDLARRMENIVQQGADPERRAQVGFRHDVAYTLRDLEKAVVPIDIALTIRTEMKRLADSAPGLESERMLALMRSTAELQDRGLIREIRAAGKDIGLQADQATPETLSKIETFENRVRLAQRPAEAQSAQDPGKAPEQKSEARGPAAQERQQPDDRAAGTQWPAAATPNDTPRQHGGQQQGGQQPGGQQHQQVLVARSPLDAIFSALRPAETSKGAPWDPPPTPMKDRIAAFEKTMQEGIDDQSIRKAEKSGRAALDALQGFSTGEGAAVMSRLREAARADPGGMAGVLSEMREGGRFADLRQQFNNALVDERGATGAYDRAASALARYGENRPALEQVIARRPDAANLSAKFEQLDAAIGEAAGNTPSRKDGRSMGDDLSKAASELLQRAVDGLKSMFARSPTADATARHSSPSASPG